MEREIVNFVEDDGPQWMALLDCGHFQHMRHSPPLIEREWVLSEEGRASHLGTSLNCVSCDEREIPGIAVYLSTSPSFTELTIPEALRKRRHSGTGLWAKVCVTEGSLELEMFEPINEKQTLTPDNPAVLPPGVPYSLATPAQVKFHIEFLKVSNDI